MLELGVIVPSTASAYSQAHLVPKTDPNTWRFCIDFVSLNASTPLVEAWPLRNIPEMLNHIGSFKPKYFGIMDLTAGYHQAPLSAKAMLYTAFICFMGLYMWCRVVIGLKGAASYFQRVLVTVVLSGLVHTTCECYIDDVCVWGQTGLELLTKLRAVFERFRKFNIILSPKKCKFGQA